MKLILIFLLFQLIFTQNQTTKNNMYTYSYLATQFYIQYSKNIVPFQGKTEMTKCFATYDIKINDTLFEYDKNETISSNNIILPDLEKIKLDIKTLTTDIYTQNKFLLSIFIFNILINPKNKIEGFYEKMRLFILHFPLDEINPIELFINRSNIEEYLINKEWLEYNGNDEIELFNKIAKKCLEINIENKNDVNYVLFGKIYYFVKLNSFDINGNAVILPFFDRCNANPFYLHKNNINYNSIFLENSADKIIVKSKINIRQSDQFSYSYGYSLSNDYLLLTQGKVIFNNINDKYIINKNLTFENDRQLGTLILNSNMNTEEIRKIKIFTYLNKRYANVHFELFPNKISDLLRKICLAYFNKNMLNSFTMIIKICFDELNNISKIIKDKYKTKKFENYLLKIQKEEEINGINSTIMKFNLAKINILEKNVKLAAEKIIEINLNEIANLKQNYIKF